MLLLGYSYIHRFCVVKYISILHRMAAFGVCVCVFFHKFVGQAGKLMHVPVHVWSIPLLSPGNCKFII